MSKKRLGWSQIFILICLSAVSCSTESIHSGKLTEEQRARALLDIANGALMEGDPIGALSNLLEAEKMSPNVAEIHHSKALAYHSQGNFEKAIESAKRATALKPKYSDANNTVGRLLLDRGKLIEAEDYLSKAVDDPIYRGVFKAQTNLGILYYRQGKFNLAETFFNRAIQGAPDVACDAYYYRGNLLLRQNLPARASSDYKNAIKGSCGNFVEAHYALGLAYFKNKQNDLAKKKFLEITQLYPESPISKKAFDRLRYIP